MMVNANDARAPVYSTKRSEHMGNPVLEIIDSEHGFFNDPFRFGILKAQMILNARKYIEEFVETYHLDENSVDFPAESYEAGDLGEEMTMRIERRPDFTNSRGQLIEQPFLKLIMTAPIEKSIGFGVRKATAILELYLEIAEWVHSMR